MNNFFFPPRHCEYKEVVQCRKHKNRLPHRRDALPAMSVIYALMLAMTMFFTIPAHALETQSGDSCAGDVTGAMRITGGPENANISETLVCNGTIWEVQRLCSPPSGCTSVGDVCADGSLFAGFVVYGNSTCEPLFVTDNNQSAAIQWKTSTGTNDISTDDHVDGQVNAANRGGVISSFPAFDLCESNTYHGKSDWYLPARAELNLLWVNRAAIDVNAAGNFTVSAYRSSTEYDTSYVWYQNFGSGAQTITTKTLNYGVRCVRRN